MSDAENHLDTAMCAGCYKTFPCCKLQKCSACKLVSYCSKACQAKDWKRGHKQSCRQSTNSQKRAQSDGHKREQRLFTLWNGCITSFFTRYFPFCRLKQLAENNEIIAFVIKFDYNYETFVLDRPPEIQCSSSVCSAERCQTNRDWYRAPSPESCLRAVIQVVLQIGESDYFVNWQVVLVPKSDEYLPLVSYPELNSRCRGIQLSSRLFATWGPLHKSNVKLQLEALESQADLKTFVENALRLYSKNPRHMTHMVVIRCKFGFGLGQIEELTSFEIQQISEVVDMVMHSNMTEEDKQKCKINQLDVESSPRLMKRRQGDPHAVLMPVALVSPDLAPTIHTLFSGLPPNRPLKSAVSSQKEAKRQFEQLQKFTFPQVESPELH